MMGTAQHTTPAWWIVCVHEIKVRLRSKAFWISTIISLLAIVIAGVIGGIANNSMSEIFDDHDTYTLVTSDERSADLARQFSAATDDGDYTLVEAHSPDEALAMLVEDQADTYLHWNDGWVLTSDDSIMAHTSTTVTALRTYLETQTLHDLADQVGIGDQELYQRITVTAESINTDDNQVFREVINIVSAVILAVLFTLTSMMYGQQIATTIVEEKQSRIIEILLATVSERALMVGKIMAGTIMAFAQMLLICAVALGMASQLLPTAQPSVPVDKSVLPVDSSIISTYSILVAFLWFLLFFVVGFIGLATLWAATGATVSRVQDLQYAATPVAMLMMVIYLVAIVAPMSIRPVLSWVPLLSTLLMPGRILAGDVSWWQPMIALLLNLVFAGLMTLLSAKIYRRMIMQTTPGRITLFSALKSAR